MKHVAVIGGGVVGLSTASALLASGFEVSLIERESAVAQGASHANGGQLSYRYVSPLADAGVPLKALGWMCKQDSPQQFRVEFSLQQWSWIARFLVHCTARANRITTDRLLRLGRLSQDTFSAVSMALPAADIALRTPGKLVIYRSPGELAKAAASARNNGEAGSGEVSLLSPSECVTLEPALADAKRLLVGGVFTRNEAVADCQKFCHELLARLNRESNFTLITSSAASSLVLRQNRLVAVQIGQREIAVTDAVIAAGLGSVDLAASVGLRLPIYPIKGYSLSAAIGPSHCAPDISVTDFEQKVLYARIGQQLRIAAMADIVGNDVTVDPRRLNALKRIVRATLPNAGDYANAVAWAGLRPSTPSGAPILGATPISGLWLNVGHGPLGFTFASGSAHILAELIAGRPSPISLDGLSFGSA